MSNGILFVFLLTLFVPGLVYTDCPENKSELRDEERLYKTLKCNFNEDARPVKDYKTAIDVKLRFVFKYIIFDTAKETMSVHSGVVFNWKDEFLTWSPSDYDGIKDIVIRSHEIWSPRMKLFNADASLYEPDTLYTYCLLNYDGMVTCFPRLAFTAICLSNLSSWPYDTQNCTLHLGSIMNTEAQVNLTLYQNEPVVLDEFQNAPGWKLLKVVHDRTTGNQEHKCCSHRPEPILKFTFLVRRESAGLVVVVIVPSVVVVLLTLSSLLLHVKDNTRLVMMCFSLFNHFAVILEIGYVVPKLSFDTPFILLFVRDSMIMTLFGILETLLMMTLTRQTLPAPTWIVSINRLVVRGLGKYVIFSDLDPSVDVDRKLNTEEGTTNTIDEKPRIDMNWIKFANLINSCVFILYFLVYLILVCKYIPSNN